MVMHKERNQKIIRITNIYNGCQDSTLIFWNLLSSCFSAIFSAIKQWFSVSHVEFESIGIPDCVIFNCGHQDDSLDGCGDYRLSLQNACSSNQSMSYDDSKFMGIIQLSGWQPFLNFSCGVFEGLWWYKVHLQVIDWYAFEGMIFRNRNGNIHGCPGDNLFLQNIHLNTHAINFLRKCKKI